MCTVERNPNVQDRQTTDIGHSCSKLFEETVNCCIGARLRTRRRSKYLRSITSFYWSWPAGIFVELVICELQWYPNYTNTSSVSILFAQLWTNCPHASIMPRTDCKSTMGIQWGVTLPPVNVADEYFLNISNDCRILLGCDIDLMQRSANVNINKIVSKNWIVHYLITIVNIEHNQFVMRLNDIFMISARRLYCHALFNVEEISGSSASSLVWSQQNPFILARTLQTV